VSEARHVHEEFALLSIQAASDTDRLATFRPKQSWSPIQIP
jgi:hypothetical protein